MINFQGILKRGSAVCTLFLALPDSHQASSDFLSPPCARDQFSEDRKDSAISLMIRVIFAGGSSLF